MPTSFGLFNCLWLAGHAAPRIGPSGKRSRAQGSASEVGTFSIWRQEGSLSSPWLAFPGSVSTGVFKSSAIPGGLVLAAAAGYVGTCSYTSEHCAFPVIRFVGLLVRERAFFCPHSAVQPASIANIACPAGPELGALPIFSAAFACALCA